MYELLSASARHRNSWARLHPTAAAAAVPVTEPPPAAHRNDISEHDEAPEISASGGVVDDDLLRGVGTSGSELDATDILTINESRFHHDRHHHTSDGGGDGDASIDNINGGDTITTTTTTTSGATESLPKKRHLPRPLYIDATAVKFSLPLSADLEISVEVAAVHAEVAAARGLHLLHTEAATLSMKGTFFLLNLLTSLLK